MHTEQIEQYEALKEELLALRRRLGAEEQAVTDSTQQYNRLSCAAADGDEQAAAEAAGLRTREEQIKAKINGLKIQIAQRETVKAQLDQAIMADAEAQWKQAAKEKWEAVVSQCRDARVKVARLEKEVAVLTEEADVAQEVFEHAQARLDEHRATPADPLGLSPSELARARRRDAKLLAAYNEAMKQRNNANANKGASRAEWQAAGREFERLALVERLTCPPDMAKARAKVPATIGEALQTAQ